MKSKQRHVLIVSLVLIAVIGGGLAYRHHHRYKHLATHEKGMVYRSAWVEPDVMQELIEHYQIRTVVNLCIPGEMGEQRWVDEKNAVVGSGAKFVPLNMPFQVEPNAEIISQHIDLLSDPNNYPLLVHCQHGVTRTAKFLALYDMIFHGKTADESLDAMPLFGREDHNVNVRAFAKAFDKQRKAEVVQARGESLKILRQ